MNIVALAAVGYIALTLIIGVIAGRRGGGGKGVREFFIAGGNLRWPLLVPFLMAAYISSGTLVGAAEMAHGSGIQALWQPLAAPIGIALLVFGVAGFYKRINKITLGEVFGTLFDQKTRRVFVIMLFLTTGLVSGGAVLATAAIIEPIFNISYYAAVWLSAAVLVGIALLGLRGIAWMNVVHLTVIAICIVTGSLVIFDTSGGLSHVFKSLPSEHLNIMRPGTPTVIAWVTGSIFYKVVAAIGVMAVFAAKDAKNIKIGGVVASAGIFIFTVLPLLIGLCAYVIFPDIPSRLALFEMADYCGPVIATLISIGILAAVISTVPGVYLSLGALASRDVFLAIKPDASEKAQINFSRLFIPFIGFGGTLFALTQPTIMDLSLRMVQVKLVLGIVFAVSVLWRRLDPLSAFWTMILGGASGLIWWFAGLPFGIAPMYPMLAVSAITMLITSLIRKPSHFKGSEGLDLKLET
ncbi:sodium:solute symporter [Chloroflexota bacterium]